jgi:ribonuclease D
MDRHGREIISAVKKALSLPAGQLPRYPRHRPKTVSAVAADRIRVLRRWRETQARRLTIDPSLICSKPAMTAIAERRPIKVEDLVELDGLRQWQRKAFGKEIIAVLQKER